MAPHAPILDEASQQIRKHVGERAVRHVLERRHVRLHRAREVVAHAVQLGARETVGSRQAPHERAARVVVRGDQRVRVGTTEHLDRRVEGLVRLALARKVQLGVAHALLLPVRAAHELDGRVHAALRTPLAHGLSLSTRVGDVVGEEPHERRVIESLRVESSALCTKVTREWIEGNFDNHTTYVVRGANKALTFSVRNKNTRHKKSTLGTLN